jgi:hypothetical protein
MRTDLNRSLVLHQADLSMARRDEMFRLLGEHFSGVTRAQFERDLAEKNWVILIAQSTRLVGFSTLLAYETVFAGAPVSVIYSGDTIMAREAWGSTALPRAWIETVNELRATYSRGPFYWLLLTSGFRTYRFLSVFWRNFWPRFDVSADAGERRLLNHLAAERFGGQFNPTRGVVRFPHPQKLRPALAEVPAGRATDPHVACFLARNPCYAEGDELVCLTELSADNLTAAGRRMLAPARHETAASIC